MKRWLFALGAAGLVAALGPAVAQQPEIRISRTTTMAYLPLMVIEHEKLLEKHAAQADIPNLKVTIATFTGPSAQFDALFSGNVDVVAVGSTALITLWARTKGTANEVTPRAMQTYADFMFGVGTVKRRPDKWSDLFFGETGQLNGS
jgi:NitT/TauT family transport system substrate-binding protein